MGKALAERGVKQAAWVSWDHAAGKEAGEGFGDGLRSAGARLTKSLTMPFPTLNFHHAAGAWLPGLGDRGRPLCAWP